MLRRFNAIQFLPSFENCTHIILTLPSSKSDPFPKGVSLTIAAATGCVSCPVTTIKWLFSEFFRYGNAPLFEGADGKPLHYNAFFKGICAVLASASLSLSLYAGHSFHQGAGV
jgi:hypothetical protein